MNTVLDNWDKCQSNEDQLRFFNKNDTIRVARYHVREKTCSKKEAIQVVKDHNKQRRKLAKNRFFFISGK